MINKYLLTIPTRSNAYDPFYAKDKRCASLFSSCLTTWMKELPKDQFTILSFCGATREMLHSDQDFFINSYLPNFTHVSSNEMTPKPDNYLNLPLKTLAIFEKALQIDQDWDFLIKCDDDIYVNTQNLINFLEDKDPNSHFYTGNPIGFKKYNAQVKRLLFGYIDYNDYMKDIESLPDDFKYAQGGLYIISRHTLTKSIEYLKKVLQTQGPEDFLVALGIYKATGHRINLGYRNGNIFYSAVGLNEKNCDWEIDILKNLISLHPLKNPNCIFSIHNKLQSLK